VGEDGFAHVLDLLFFDFEDALPVFLLCDFDCGLGLALFVFERAVEEDNAGVFDAAAHFGVGDVFIEHDAVEDAGVLDLAAGYLFYARVAFCVDFFLASNFARYCSDCL